MMMEVAMPPGVSVDKIERSLSEVKDRQGVELTIRPLEQDAL